MLIYATRDLRKGDEITHSYVHPSYEYAERHRRCKNQWGFECDCRLCELDKVDPECSKRARLVTEFREFADANQDNPVEVIFRGRDVLDQVGFLRIFLEYVYLDGIYDLEVYSGVYLAQLV
jgi:hypothetical protein